MPSLGAARDAPWARTAGLETLYQGEGARTFVVKALAAIESTFDPLPVSVDVARVWGQLAAAVARRGGNPRRRQIDLAIAATARVEGVPLLTENVGDFQIIHDLVDARRLSDR